jgi:hypothetical protein
VSPRPGAVVLGLLVLLLMVASAVAPAAARAALIITSGPSGDWPSDDAVFTFELTGDERPDDDDED